jgi:hypothetical protein
VPRADLAVLRAKDPYLAFTRALIASIRTRAV